MEKEVTWIDAWIRWDRNSKDIVDEDENCDFGEEERVPPTTEFLFDYKLPMQEFGSRSSKPLDLTLNLKGFPSESEQIWNSTGLTLWPSSHYLCEYLLDHYRELLPIFASDPLNRTKCDVENDISEKIPEKSRKIHAIELGAGLGRCGLLLHHVMTVQCRASSHVYLTDGDTDTLAQLRDNVNNNTNEYGAIETDNDQKREQQSDPHDVSCHQLLWGTDSTKAFCDLHFPKCLSGEPSDNIADAENHHSSDTVANGGVDFVFGSDLIYAPRVIEPLFETVSTLLINGSRANLSQQQKTTDTTTTITRNTKPMFLMAHSDRREGSSVTLNMVLQGAGTAGLQFEILQEVEREGIYIIAFQIRQSAIT